jgi:hydrogenase maturation factor HypF (carbamoyltransferase family)
MNALVSGLAQSVGLRHFVFSLGSRHNLSGSVCNISTSAEIDVEGVPESLEIFLQELRTDTPARASIG